MTDEAILGVRAAIYRGAILYFGTEHQTRKAVEELTELSIALQRALDGRADMDNIREEMADVAIMLEQLKLIYGPIEEWLRKKLERLASLTSQ